MPPAERHERIKQAVRQVHAESYGIYGSHKVAEVMQTRADVESACRNTVATAMRELSIKSRVSKSFTPTTTQADRGCQYTSDAYQRTLRRLGIECSMSRTGCCYDNAAMERFFWSLKHEWTNHNKFANLKEARLSVFKYIETFYNPVRLHQTLGYLSPDQYEAENAPVQAA